MKTKIFIGYQDLCSTIGEMTSAFKDMGFDVFSALHDQNNQFDVSKVDFNIEKKTEDFFKSLQFKIQYKLFNTKAVDYIKSKLLKKAIKECDIFILYHPSLFPDSSDLELIKKAGKKIICLLFGDDVRWYNAMLQQFASKEKPPIEYEKEYLDSLTIDKWVGYLRHVEKYADLIIMHPDTAHMALRPYNHYYMQLDASKFPLSIPQRKTRPIVAHAPSFKKGKGTSYILKAVSELQTEGLEFEFRLMEKVPYKQVSKFYQDIDIMVVQMFGHGGGKQSYELLSCGKVVISRMQYDEYLPHIKEECPIIDADIYSLKEILRNTILDYNKRVKLSKIGRDYVLKYHDVNAFCKRIINALEISNTPDYIPSFYRNEYKPAENEIVDLNKWTQFVSDCKWYKNYIKPGERAGLKF
ncbi:MAG: hypothetical protein WCH21_06910 [Bacteroidota bacterium]